jgi:hypothetical protein
MANPPQDQDDERQYALDQITAHYEDEYRAGKSPKIAEYIQRYPQFARELREYALLFHTIGVDQPEPDPTPAPQFSIAAEIARARIREQLVSGARTPLSGIIKQGRLAGYMAPKLAEMVGLSLDILAKLDAHAIIGASIPRTLIQRLAATLRVTPEAVASYLASPQTAQGGAFFYADQAPRQRQESFQDAVQNSPALSAALKREWGEIIEQEQPSG